MSFLTSGARWSFLKFFKTHSTCSCTCWNLTNRCKPLHIAHKLITFLLITLQHKDHYEYTITQIIDQFSQCRKWAECTTVSSIPWWQLHCSFRKWVRCRSKLTRWIDAEKRWPIFLIGQATNGSRKSLYYTSTCGKGDNWYEGWCKVFGRWMYRSSSCRIRISSVCYCICHHYGFIVQKCWQMWKQRWYDGFWVWLVRQLLLLLV